MLRKLAFALAALAIAVACICASTYYRLYFGDSIKRGAELRKILKEAKSVTAYEYAIVAAPSQPPVYSELLAKKHLSPAEIGKFIDAFSATGKLPSAMCFEPHQCWPKAGLRRLRAAYPSRSLSGGTICQHRFQRLVSKPIKKNWPLITHRV